MKTRVKIFSDDRANDLESSVNKWIEEMEENPEGFEIISTMQSGRPATSFDKITGYTVITIVYKVSK